MSFRESIGSLNSSGWSIDLATHLGTKIENETNSPDLKPTLSRQKAEARYASMTKHRNPISGYNCFGLVFAGRRTSLYNPDIPLLVSEDGYGEVPPASEIALGDVVVYEDAHGPTHTAVVLRIAPSLVGVSGAGNTVWVLSKFDDSSGEYEHALDNTSWYPLPGHVSRKVYRPRTQTPRKPRSWKTKLEELEP